MFLSDAARQRFLGDLLALQRALPFVIHAYCLMTNHIHLLLEAIEKELSEVMKKLLGQHAMRMNKDLGRIGHLFQRRYDDAPCWSEHHYLNAVAYISNNPVRARLVADPSQWLWSSHLELVGVAENRFIDRAKVLEAFGGLEEYERLLLRQPLSEAVRIANELSGPKFDADAFRDLTGTDLKSFLDSLAHDAAANAGLRFEDVVGSARTRNESLARKNFIEAARAVGVPGKQIAFYLGRTPGYVSQQTTKQGV